MLNQNRKSAKVVKTLALLFFINESCGKGRLLRKQNNFSMVFVKGLLMKCPPMCIYGIITSCVFLQLP